MTESEQTLIECPTCGAAVLNTATHETWHAGLTPEAITAMVGKGISWAMR